MLLLENKWCGRAGMRLDAKKVLSPITTQKLITFQWQHDSLTMTFKRIK